MLLQFTANKNYKTDGTSLYEKTVTFPLSGENGILTNAPYGEYTFEIKETAPTAATPQTPESKTFGWTAVDSQKTVYAHVIKSHDKEGNDSYSYYLTETNEAVGSETKKLDAAAFVNTYTGKGDLTIGKDVKDDAGITDLDDTFTLDINFAFPDTATDAQKSFEGSIINGTTGQNNETSVSVSSTNRNVQVVLKRGGRVTFTNVPSGTTYTVSESHMSRPNYTYTGTTVKVGGAEIKDANTPYAVDTNGENSAIVNNTAKDITMTGVVLNNMPFIVMMAAAAAAIFGYVALKRKISK